MTVEIYPGLTVGGIGTLPLEVVKRDGGLKVLQAMQVLSRLPTSSGWATATNEKHLSLSIKKKFNLYLVMPLSAGKVCYIWT